MYCMEFRRKRRLHFLVIFQENFSSFWSRRSSSSSHESDISMIFLKLSLCIIPW